MIVQNHLFLFVKNHRTSIRNHGYRNENHLSGIIVDKIVGEGGIIKLIIFNNKREEYE